MKDIAFPQFGIVAFLAACLLLGGGSAAAQSCNVRGWYNSTAVPIIGEMSVPFVAMPGHSELSVGFDDHAVFSEFSRPGEDEMDVLIETTYPQARPCYDADRDSTVLSMPGGAMPRVYLVGERKIVVVAGSGVAVKSLTLAEIGGILAGEEKDAQPGAAVPQGEGKSQPGMAVPQAEGKSQSRRAGTVLQRFAGGHLYCEADKSWCRWALSAWCLQYVIQKPGYKILAHHPFREDITDCVDGDEVVAKVKRDPRGIGFFQYRPGMHALQGVHVVPISTGDGKPAVAFKEGDWPQEGTGRHEGDVAGATVSNPSGHEDGVAGATPSSGDYPLAEPILLYLHPKAPPLAKAFCEFAVGKQAAAIAAKYGVVTAYAQKQAEGEERLREAAAGKGPAVAVIGPAQTRELLRDLEPAYVRADAVMRMAYVVQTGAAAVEAWHKGGRHGVLILSETDLKKLETASGGSGTVGETPVLLASRAVAVIVNGHSPLKAMTVEELRGAFVMGKLPDGSVPMGMDAAVHGYGVDAPDPSSYLFWRGIGAAGSGRVKYERSADAVIKAVAGDRAGMGFVNAADLPATAAEMKKAGIKVLAVGDAKSATGPRGKGNQGGPLAERWYLLVDPQADAGTKEFADFLTGGGGDGDAADVIKRDGFAAVSMPLNP